jgi:uridine kinase
LDTIVIGISGGSGSGKTRFVNDLTARFGNGEICFLHQDNYYKPIEQQEKDDEGIENFDLPDSLFLDKFAEDIKKLKNGESVVFTEYTFNNETSESKVITIEPAKVIIAEGLFLFHHEVIREQLDLSIIIHADDSNRIIRRIKRDRKERNYPVDDVMYRYEHHVMPSYRLYIYPYLTDVDIVVNNNKSYNRSLDVLSAFITSKNS